MRLVGRPRGLPQTPGINWPLRLRVTGGLCHGKMGLRGKRSSSVGIARPDSFSVYAPLFSARFFGVDGFQLCPVAIRRSLLARTLRHFGMVGAIHEADSRR